MSQSKKTDQPKKLIADLKQNVVYWKDKYVESETKAKTYEGRVKALDLKIEEVCTHNADCRREALEIDFENHKLKNEIKDLKEKLPNPLHRIYTFPNEASRNPVSINVLSICESYGFIPINLTYKEAKQLSVYLKNIIDLTN